MSWNLILNKSYYRGWTFSSCTTRRMLGIYLVFTIWSFYYAVASSCRFVRFCRLAPVLLVVVTTGEFQDHDQAQAPVHSPSVLPFPLGSRCQRLVTDWLPFWLQWSELYSLWKPTANPCTQICLMNNSNVQGICHTNTESSDVMVYHDT